MKKNFSSLQDVLLFLQMSSLMLALPAMLRLLSIPRLMGLLTPRRITNAQNTDTDTVRDKTVRYVDYILGNSFWIFKSTCLRRSLLLYHFLRRAGINVQICIGVRYREDSSMERASKELMGHAWLLYKGDVFLERNAAIAREYKITYSFPPEGDDVSMEGFELSGGNR